MLKNYFTVAFRSLRRNKLFSLINIFSLAIGISASLVIYLLVSYHFSFNTVLEDKERIYRTVTDFNFSGQVYYNSGVPVPFEAALKKEGTGIAEVVAFRTLNTISRISIPQATTKAPVIFKKPGKICVCR